MVYVPQVNNNGTNAHELIEQYVEARRAVLVAFKALQASAPHGRDYQTCRDTERYRLARQQHNIWLSQLDDMAKALEEIAFQVYDQATPFTQVRVAEIGTDRRLSG